MSYHDTFSAENLFMPQTLNISLTLTQPHTYFRSASSLPAWAMVNGMEANR